MHGTNGQGSKALLLMVHGYRDKIYSADYLTSDTLQLEEICEDYNNFCFEKVLYIKNLTHVSPVLYMYINKNTGSYSKVSSKLMQQSIFSIAKTNPY